MANLATIAREPIEASRGLQALAAIGTDLGAVRDVQGSDQYRQYSVIELADNRPLEDVWMLMIDGVLPGTVGRRGAFCGEVRQLRTIPSALAEVLPAIAHSCTPLDGLRMALSLAVAQRGVQPLGDSGRSQRRADALFVAAITPTLLAALYRLRHDREPIAPREEYDYAENYLWMLTGVEPTPRIAALFERYLISAIDPGSDTADVTAQLIASTGADIGACVTGAISALGAQLPGACSGAVQLLEEIGSPERAELTLATKLFDGEQLPGFVAADEHTVEPRAELLRHLTRDFGGEFARLALMVEDTAAELTPDRRIGADARYYAGVVMALCGVPTELFTATLASARVIGWSANVLEQAGSAQSTQPTLRPLSPTPKVSVPGLL